MRDVRVDPVNVRFARVMEILTTIGLLVMIIPAIGYFMGINEFVSLEEAIKHWDKPAHNFWEEIKGIKISGYSWFLNNLTYTDCLSVIGIVILALTPLISLVVSIPKAEKLYKVLLLILVIEFIIAILRPLFMHVTGH